MGINNGNNERLVEKESNFEKQTNTPKEPCSNGYRRPLRRDRCLSFGGPWFDSP